MQAIHDHIGKDGFRLRGTAMSRVDGFSDVVLVAVGKHDASDLGTVFDKVANIGDDDVDAEQLFFGEHQAGVYDEDIVAESEREAIHAELAESAEGDHLQFF